MCVLLQLTLVKPVRKVSKETAEELWSPLQPQKSLRESLYWQE